MADGIFSLHKRKKAAPPATFIDLFGAGASLEMFTFVIHASLVSFTPLDEGLPEIFRWHYVLPLHAQRAFDMFFGLKSFWQRHIFFDVERRAAVKSLPMIEIDFLFQHAFGLGKRVIGRVALSPDLSGRQPEGDGQKKRQNF